MSEKNYFENELSHEKWIGFTIMQWVRVAFFPSVVGSWINGPFIHASFMLALKGASFFLRVAWSGRNKVLMTFFSGIIFGCWYGLQKDGTPVGYGSRRRSFLLFLSSFNKW
jgi:hypothetical protein